MVARPTLGYVIHSAIVASDDVRRGIRRLLEKEGDIRVVCSSPHLSAGTPPDAVIVLDPGVRAGLADWEMLLDGRGVVVLVPLPGWRTYPEAVSQVPMDLSGERLRGGVRAQARSRSLAPMATGVPLIWLPGVASKMIGRDGTSGRR